MRIFVIFLFLLICLPVIAVNYSVQNYNNIDKHTFDTENEQVLFILDFSNSMTETLGEDSKINLMVKTMKNILPTLNPQSLIGLRVYGHRMGFTPMDACKASVLVNPIKTHNTTNILSSLDKIHPRGMTPITYSLKQAVKNDFPDYLGKKHIILLSDGGENCDESPCEYVMNLVKLRKDINIDVIAFNINDEDDLDQLKCTALVTKGKFYNANTAAELVHSLGDTLNKQKRVEAKIITHD